MTEQVGVLPAWSRGSRKQSRLRSENWEGSQNFQDWIPRISKIT